MASDLAPFFTNLFLCYHKSKFISKIKKTTIKRAGRFVNTFTFINDSAVPNYGNEFERSFRAIHSAKVELQKDNCINIEGSLFGSGY